MSKYLKDLTERALSTFAGGVLTVFGVGAIDVLHADWVTALSVGAGAAVVSVLKSLAAKGVGDGDTAALLPVGK